MKIKSLTFKTFSRRIYILQKNRYQHHRLDNLENLQISNKSNINKKWKRGQTMKMDANIGITYICF